MGVDSYLEMFTTMYGWMFSSIITRVWFDTGLFLLPAVFMLVGTLMQAHERGLDGDDGAEWLVRKLELQIAVMLFMFFTCVQTFPGISLSRASLEYVPLSTAADPAPRAATGDKPDSTYGAAFAGRADVAAVPAWWYLVMTLSSGVNSAVRAGIGSGVRDFRMIEDLAHMASIPDTRLRAEVQRFYSECFVPARSRYLRQEAVSAPAQAAIARYGEQDVDWIGSHAFRDDPALYEDLRSVNPVPGFLYDPVRDSEYPKDNPPKYGRPSCKQWWETAGNGLRARMVEQIGRFENLRTRVTAAFKGMSADEVDDQLSRLATVKADPEYVDPERQIGFARARRPVGHAAQDMAGFGGTAWEAFKASASMIPLVQSLLMMQPMVLMTLYMFLTTIVIFSGYRIEVFVLGALAIFTVKFWSVMWTIARFVDDRLIEAMYPGASGNALLEAVLTSDGTSKRMILNIVTMMMYVGIPAIWTAMVGWAGYNLSANFGKLVTSVEAKADTAGSNGSGLSAKLAMKGLKRKK